MHKTEHLKLLRILGFILGVFGVWARFWGM